MTTRKRATKKTKPTFKVPIGRYIKAPDGTKYFVIDLGYRTNSVELVKENR